MINKNSDLIKHSSAIHISNKVSLLQRKCWNVLLANAYNDLPTTDVYSMQIDELTDTLGFDSKNIDYIKNSLRALSRVEVEWDIL
ncbi:RepB family plasmid replication initiator protein [bacterium]|nr:RepB family plasmid replication initiator protein [bacterium]